MKALRVALAVLAALLLGAHLLRAGWLLPATAAAASPLLLLLARSWAVRLLQFILALAALEWVRTAFVLVQRRVSLGQPFTRLALILGAVALLSVAAAVLVGPQARRPGARG